ncbi:MULTISPECIES: MotA/TolQ/ExbB proton channel family protein [Desulfovibrio]|jgi:chemotaxis protein MotA|uniref:motility protein A n=1 Tax=Desulfovibrio TaxID=872 RepID=UPI0004241AC4|nr:MULTISPECIES: MotA/TolQ/ExbB proton channel family protein [Desulfovibrio]MDY0305881.1 MotA/TolQ/ExbB proton channel family protein [Desulfovibrionaceae bacterium]HMM37945.1 MotA/TolQ/ExbB proton channel family protein [Desulfovibrio sp.]
MDFATLLGLLFGLSLVIGAIYMGGDMMIFFDLPSAMIVLGGSLASICIAFPFEEVIQAFYAGFKIFATKRVQARDVVNIMVKVAEISRREGLLALENVQTENMVLKKSCQLIADNADPDLIRTTLAIEIGSMKRRHKVAQDVFTRLGGLAPAFGMIGTLIGLIQMLTRLDDPKSIGPAMAVAIITTFYGSLLSTILFLPISIKLKARTLQEQLHLEIIFEGAKSILENNNPRLVYEKLSSFLAPKERE